MYNCVTIKAVMSNRSKSIINNFFWWLSSMLNNQWNDSFLCMCRAVPSKRLFSSAGTCSRFWCDHHANHYVILGLCPYIYGNIHWFSKQTFRSPPTDYFHWLIHQLIDIQHAIIDTEVPYWFLALVAMHVTKCSSWMGTEDLTCNFCFLSTIYRVLFAASKISDPEEDCKI